MSDAPLPGRRVDIPLPPELAETFGYRGDARFVAFCHSPAGDEVICTDGPTTGSGATWAFQAYRRHPAVAPLLAGWQFGNSDQDAEYALVIDREQNRASVATVREAGPFLEDQHPPPPELTPEQQAVFREEVDRLLAEWREQPLDAAAVTRAMREQHARVGRMVSFLDLCPVPARDDGPTPS